MSTDRMPFHIMDELLAHADDPVEPVTVQIEARVLGHLDESRTRAAILSAIGAHPLTRARLEPWSDKGTGYDWLVDEDPQIDPFRVLERDDDLDAIRSEFYSRPLSLFESPPLRVLLVRGRESDTLMISMHHSASDGMGARRFLQSVLRRYSDIDDPIPEIRPDEARSYAEPSSRLNAGDLVRMGKVEFQRLGRAGSKASTVSPDGGATRPGYGIHTMSSIPLGPIVTSPLRKDVGATVNDVLIAAASRAAAQWIEEHGGEAGRISISMPMNARPSEWSTEVVANLVTGESVTTGIEVRASARSCLADIAGWTEAVKQRGPGPAMAALSRIPRRGVGGRRAAIHAVSWLGGGSPIGTMVLSNLGRVPPEWLGSGAPDVSSLHFSPPTAMPSGLGLGAVAIGDALVLTIRHRWALWSSDAAERFALLLQSELDELSAI